MPGMEKLPWKAMQSLHSSGCECILATMISRFPMRARRSHLVGLSARALGFAAAPAGRPCLMLQLPWQRALWRLVQRGRTTLLLEGGGRSCTPVPPPDAARANRHRHPPPPALPSSSQRTATPDVREGKFPRKSQVAMRQTPPPNLATMVTRRLPRLLGTV